MSTDEQRRPSTLAGQELLHDLNFDPHQRQRLKGAILAIEAEAGAERDRLQRIVDLQPQAVEYIRRNGFVLDRIGPLSSESTELDRWKVLAFSLYTDLVEASSTAEAMLREA